MESEDLMAIGVVGLVLWLLLRKPQVAPVAETPLEEVVTSDIVYDF